MRIRKISVRELFSIDTFTYDIELKTEQRITIIHGPNGSGKTVLFKMIDGLFNRRYLVFLKYPFTEFTVTFDNGEYIMVKREPDAKSKRNLSFEITHSKSSPPFKFEIDQDIYKYPPLLRRQLSLFEYEDFARLTSSERVATIEGYAEEMIIRYGEELFTHLLKEPKWLRALQEKLKVNFINTNRLLVNKPDSHSGKKQGLITATAITENSKDISTRIQEEILEADTKAKDLDRTFPSRIVRNVVTKKKTSSMKYEKIREELEKLEIERRRLTEAGLLESGSQEAEFQIPERIDSTEQEGTLRSVLTMYIADTKKKLEVYQELANKIELFKDIIQSMLRHKKLHLSKTGFELKSDNGMTIPLEELSSGEQHILVVVYNLLFRKYESANELILIDEPEISLHISWQKRFIGDLARINQLSNFDVVIATHSPAIINGRLDLMVDIQGTIGGEE